MSPKISPKTQGRTIKSTGMELVVPHTTRLGRCLPDNLESGPIQPGIHTQTVYAVPVLTLDSGGLREFGRLVWRTIRTIVWNTRKQTAIRTDFSAPDTCSRAHVIQPGMNKSLQAAWWTR